MPLSSWEIIMVFNQTQGHLLYRSFTLTKEIWKKTGISSCISIVLHKCKNTLRKSVYIPIHTDADNKPSFSVRGFSEKASRAEKRRSSINFFFPLLPLLFKWCIKQDVYTYWALASWQRLTWSYSIQEQSSTFPSAGKITKEHLFKSHIN